MAWAAAARNVAASLGFQLRLRGDLPARLAYAGRYWAAYFRAKYVDSVPEPELTASALRHLAEAGLTQQTVRISLPDGLKLELDQLTCFMILREIAGERIYDGPGEAFTPRPDETVFDVGAQQGVFTALCARWVGPKGKVVAFEPEPGNRAKLSRNVALNDLANVIVLADALSDTSGRATLYQSAFNPGGHSLSASAGTAGVIVEVSTLDAAVAARKLPHPDFLKIDVEGSALAILHGGLHTLAAAKPRLVMELDRIEDEGAARALLEPLGYRVEGRDNNLFAW